MLVANAVVDTDQPRLQVGENQMDDRQVLLGNLWITTLGNSEVLIAALTEASIAAPIVSNDQRSRRDGALAIVGVGGNRIGKEITMPAGTVKWFNPAKGYGFIEPEDGSKDAFVHISAVERAGLTTLNEGQKVEYEIVPGQDGKSSAEKLVLLD